MEGGATTPARVLASRFFRQLPIPVVFCAVSRDGDLGYVFVQEKDGPCLGCLYPDIADDDRFPCPGTPAIADILQGIGSLAIYTIDTLVTTRSRLWNYRRISLSDQNADGSMNISVRTACGVTEHKKF